MTIKRTLLSFAILAAATAVFASEQDLAAARALFEKNLHAIRDRDRATYLSTYLESEMLARTGFTGPRLGFEELSRTAGEGWPDTFEASDLRLVPVQPGVVYGTYRYRVRYGVDEQSGLSERFFVRTDDGWRIAVTTAFESPPGTPPPPLALVGGTLIRGTGETPVASAVVLLRDGEIECAGREEECRIVEGYRVVDTTGMWILPGLVDAHVHFSQTGWVDGRPDFIDVRESFPYEDVQAGLRDHPERLFRSYLCSGVTAVFDVGGFPWSIDLDEKNDPRAPHVVASGPLLSTIDFWLNLPAERQFLHLDEPDAAARLVRSLAARGADAVKVWYIVTPQQDPEKMAAAVEAAGREAKRAGLPLIVHATSLREAKIAVRAGARLLVHGVWDQPVDEELIRLMKERGTFYSPTLAVHRGYQRALEAFASGSPPDLDDPNGCVDPRLRDRIQETLRIAAIRIPEDRIERMRESSDAQGRIGAANLKTLSDAGVSIAMGTDAGNPLTLHGPAVHAEMEAMQDAGMTPMEVIVASTRGGSRAMGREDQWGTIEGGKQADLLIVAKDPTIDVKHLRSARWVVRGGVLRSIDELRDVVASTTLDPAEPER